MEYKFSEGDEVIWHPLPGWEAEGIIHKQTHFFWLVPAYKIWVCKSQVSDWSKWSCIWKVPESNLRSR